MTCVVVVGGEDMVKKKLWVILRGEVGSVVEREAEED